MKIEFLRKDFLAWLLSELGWLFFCFFQFLSSKAGSLKFARGNIMMALKYSEISSYGFYFMWLILLCFYAFALLKGTSEERRNCGYLLCFRILMYLIFILFPVYYNGD